MPVLANLKSIRLIVAFQIFNQWRLFWHTYVLNKELRLVKVKLITTVILSSQLCNKIAKEIKILYYTQISGVSFSQKNETFLFLCMVDIENLCWVWSWPRPWRCNYSAFAFLHSACGRDFNENRTSGGINPGGALANEFNGLRGISGLNDAFDWMHILL